MRVRSRSIEIAFICQVIAIFIVIIACVVNLSIGLDKAELWSSLLSGALGYLLPSPKIRRKNESFLHDTPLQLVSSLLPKQHSDAVHDQVDNPDSALG